MNLAAAYEGAGDVRSRAQQYAAAAPRIRSPPKWAGTTAIFCCVKRGRRKGYAQIRKAVQSDRSLLPLAASRVWRASRDVNVLVDRVFPQDADAYNRALDYFSSIMETAGFARRVGKLIGLGQPMALAKSFPLIDVLIHADDSTDALRVWVEALTAAGMP